MAALTLTHRINIWEIIALSALQGIVNGFDLPARQSFLVHMVDDKADLTNAIAINSSMNNAGRLVGPAIAGLVVAAFGEGWCFLIDGLSYLPVIASLFAMRLHASIPLRAPAQHDPPDARGLGLRPHLRAHPHHPYALLPGQPHGLWPFTTLLPIFAGQVLHGGRATPSAGSPPPPASARSPAASPSPCANPPPASPA
jgi:MFS family permease